MMKVVFCPNLDGTDFKNHSQKYCEIEQQLFSNVGRASLYRSVHSSFRSNRDCGPGPHTGQVSSDDFSLCGGFAVAVKSSIGLSSSHRLQVLFGTNVDRTYVNRWELRLGAALTAASIAFCWASRSCLDLSSEASIAFCWAWTIDWRAWNIKTFGSVDWTWLFDLRSDAFGTWSFLIALQSSNAFSV